MISAGEIGISGSWDGSALRRGIDADVAYARNAASQIGQTFGSVVAGQASGGPSTAGTGGMGSGRYADGRDTAYENRLVMDTQRQLRLEKQEATRLAREQNQHDREELQWAKQSFRVARSSIETQERGDDRGEMSWALRSFRAARSGIASQERDAATSQAENDRREMSWAVRSWRSAVASVQGSGSSGNASGFIGPQPSWWIPRTAGSSGNATGFIGPTVSGWFAAATAGGIGSPGGGFGGGGSWGYGNASGGGYTPSVYQRANGGGQMGGIRALSLLFVGRRLADEAIRDFEANVNVGLSRERGTLSDQNTADTAMSGLDIKSWLRQSERFIPGLRSIPGIVGESEGSAADINFATGQAIKSADAAQGIRDQTFKISQRLGLVGASGAGASYLESSNTLANQARDLAQQTRAFTSINAPGAEDVVKAANEQLGIDRKISAADQKLILWESLGTAAGYESRAYSAAATGLGQSYAASRSSLMQSQADESIAALASTKGLPANVANKLMAGLGIAQGAEMQSLFDSALRESTGQTAGTTSTVSSLALKYQGSFLAAANQAAYGAYNQFILSADSSKPGYAANLAAQGNLRDQTIIGNAIAEQRRLIGISTQGTQLTDLIGRNQLAATLAGIAGERQQALTGPDGKQITDKDEVKRINDIATQKETLAKQDAADSTELFSLKLKDAADVSQLFANGLDKSAHGMEIGLAMNEAVLARRQRGGANTATDIANIRKAALGQETAYLRELQFESVGTGAEEYGGTVGRGFSGSRSRLAEDPAQALKDIGKNVAKLVLSAATGVDF